MARQFPRFIYSDPQNTKSKGPFVLHTLEPKFLCRIIPAGGFIGSTTIELLEMYSGEEHSPEYVDAVTKIVYKYVNGHFK